jgi:MerR family transcriptional regulator, light-induced transcriptional regulator
MKTPRSEDLESTEPAHGDQLWPMGAVSRRTGITEHSLRAWERRFGFPRPVRLPSGHRRYTSEQVRHLLLITLALDQGCRAGDVVPMPLDRLEALLREAGALDAPTEAAPAERWLESLMDGVRRFDTATVSGLLQRDAGLLERVVPLITELGDAWADGRIDVRHEHFASQLLETSLRTLRAPQEVSASGAPLLLATLPGESHELGVQLVALASVIAGRSVRVLGASTPVDEIVAAAESLRPAAVGLSISPTTADDATRELVLELRGRLPKDVRLWLGGAGATMLGALPAEIRGLETLDDLDAALAALATEPIEGPGGRAPKRR